MALSASRAILYFLGIVLVIAALAIFFFQTGLLAAGVLLIIGLAVMSFADSAPSDHTHGHVDRGHSGHDDGGDVTVVKK
jgi:hypothetical protein